MSLIDISLLFFFFVTFIKIAVDFERHMSEPKHVKANVRSANPAYIGRTPVTSRPAGRSCQRSVPAKAKTERLPVRRAA